MKTKLFISFAAFAAASVLMSSCSNEESTATTNDQLTAFTGGIVTEVPMERVQIGTPGITTRTSMDRDKIGGEGVFLWEPNDVIYVVDDKDKLCKSQNEITKSAPRTTFLVDGSYTTNGQYDVYYYGTNTGAGAKKVVIADNQTQSEFNNTKHFGAVGDCGVAKATKTTAAGKSGYRFDLQHKASYLCFLPYIPSQQDRANLRIKRIEITSNANNISGTYDLDQTGLSGTGNSKTITLNVGTDGNGLALADQTTATKSIKNSLYVVIAPGTRKLSVKYTVFSVKENKELTLTKYYQSHDFAVNRICDIPVSLGSADLNGGHENTDGSDGLAEDYVAFTYSGHNYCMWDARENYWSGHEWDATTDPWQPTIDGATSSNYPKSKAADASRWYHEGSGSFEASNALFKQLPNANELGWYVLKGDAHWDNSTKWKVFGKVYTGGIWLKKLSVIAKENNKELADLKQADPNGKNLLQNNFDVYSISPANGKPADNVIGNYFFLPALGYYDHGKLYGLGSGGGYWSFSVYSTDSHSAYSLNFSSGGVYLLRSYRSYGFVAQPFQ
ncbi:hypothetical protein ETF27_00255 [Prevotella brunnea]|uniref:Fimbrillin family protein n=1 Tax=Prevotella brunnea TaxID=2508867 RepID=A0A5C8GQ58_9BACT|nr:hypothetical protein [Prevotella brunnea]TXJ63448.1 hypothetical protein ETF27_00255 [Prevotella brunnea]